MNVTDLIWLHLKIFGGVAGVFVAGMVLRNAWEEFALPALRNLVASSSHAHRIGRRERLFS